MLGKTINDPEISKMDDITWNWHYESWIEDQEEEMKKMKNFGCFVGAFWNPTAAKKIQSSESGEGSVELSDEDFEATLKFVKDSNIEKERIEKSTKKKKSLRLKRE